MAEENCGTLLAIANAISLAASLVGAKIIFCSSFNLPTIALKYSVYSAVSWLEPYPLIKEDSLISSLYGFSKNPQYCLNQYDVFSFFYTICQVQYRTAFCLYFCCLRSKKHLSESRNIINSRTRNNYL